MVGAGASAGAGGVGAADSPFALFQHSSHTPANWSDMVASENQDTHAFMRRSRLQIRHEMVGGSVGATCAPSVGVGWRVAGSSTIIAPQDGHTRAPAVHDDREHLQY